MENENKSIGRDDEGILRNLNRMEGQIRGIKKMVEDGRDCEDIIIQLNAVSSAAASVAKNLLYEHIRHCMVENIRHGDTQASTEELISVLDQMLKIKK